MGIVLCKIIDAIQTAIKWFFVPRDDQAIIGFKQFFTADNDNFWKLGVDDCAFLGREKVAINVALFFICFYLIIYSALAAEFYETNDNNTSSFSTIEIINMVFVILFFIGSILFFLFFYTGFMRKYPNYQLRNSVIEYLPIAFIIYAGILLVMFTTSKILENNNNNNNNNTNTIESLYPFHPAIFLSILFVLYLFYYFRYYLTIKQRVPKFTTKTQQQKLPRQSTSRRISNVPVPTNRVATSL